MRLKNGFIILIVGMTALSGSISRAEETVDLGKVVVTASRMAQYDYKVASNVTVIGPREIKESTAQTVNELLSSQLGVNVYDSGTAKTANVDMRGFGDTANRNVLVLVNDRKINSVDNSGVDLLQIPLGSIERIEIIQGAGSVLYGDNAVGGVINIITKEGKGDLSGRIGTAVGSYQSTHNDLEVSGAAKGFSYYFYSQYADTEGYRDNSELLARDFNTRLGHRMSEKVKWTLATNWHRDDYNLPGGLNDTELRTLGRRASANPDDFADTKDRSVQMTLDFDPSPGDIHLGRFVTDFSYRNRDTYAFFKDYNFGGAFNIGTKRNIDTFGVTGKYIFDQKIFDRNFNLIAGIDYYDTDNDILGSESSTDDLTITKKEWGLYLSAEAEVLRKFYINGGTRLQKADYIFDQRAGFANGYTTREAKQPVSMVGGRYEYAKGSNLFFNVQETFRFLATDEWYSIYTGLNTGLKHQDGIQYETGVKHNWNDVATTSITPYILYLHNEIFYDPTLGGGFGDNSNYGKTRRVGVDLAQTFNLLKLIPTDLFTRWQWRMDFGYLHPEFIGGANDGKVIPLATERRAGLGMDMEFHESWLLSLSGRYVGKRYAINDTLNATAALKPYWVMDTKLSYQQKNFEAFLALNNIFNEEYFSYAIKSPSSATKDYFPAPEFNIAAGVSLKF